MTERQRTIYWRRLDEPGGEYCTFRRASASWLLTGAVVGVLEGEPFSANYRIATDARWHTRDVRLTLTTPADVRQLHLTRDRDSRWWQDGKELPHLAGFEDIDLGVTPSTNTLAIRRSALAVGASAEMTAAWVVFPALTIQPLPQRYTRLVDDRYRYESFLHDFRAELVVDEWGVVLEYGDLWVCEGRV